MELDTIETKNEVKVDELLLPVSKDDVCAFPKPIIPSTCGSGVGLEGLVVGLGVFGIKSYKVLDCDKPILSTGKN